LKLHYGLEQRFVIFIFAELLSIKAAGSYFGIGSRLLPLLNWIIVGFLDCSQILFFIE
jgi:hypothetical protein